MPFFQLASKLVYFAHVPKCGGTSVERGLMDNGLKMAFRDGQWWDRAENSWNPLLAAAHQRIRLKQTDRSQLFRSFFHDRSQPCRSFFERI